MPATAMTNGRRITRSIKRWHATGRLTPDIKRGRQRHVSAPVAVFARMVLTTLSDIMPVGKWNMPRLADFRPGWEDFDGLKV
jgi:hypothetical protein